MDTIVEIRKGLIKASRTLEKLIEKEEPFTKGFHDLQKQQKAIEKSAAMLAHLENAKPLIQLILN